MKPALKVLFCDDDDRFAKTQSQNLSHKLELRHGLGPKECLIETISNLDRLRRLSKSAEAKNWDCVFCDLGWSSLTLEGIQILNNFQISHPRIFSVLYTAQNEDEIISQALRWKLDFINRIIKIEGAGYFNEMLEIIHERFQWKQDRLDAIHSAPNVVLRGLRLLALDKRESFSRKVSGRLAELQTSLLEILETGEKELAADISITREGISLKLKSDPQTQKSVLFRELIDNRRRFPNLETHSLLALDKEAYIEFVLKTYEGFPQMAEARGLDLNHIYRVNRKYRQDDFIIFRLDTIQEIIGLHEAAASQKSIQALLLSTEMLQNLS